MKYLLSSLLCAAALFPTAAFAQTDLGPLNLPSSPVPLPWTENFELGGGTVMPYMAVTNLDSNSLTPDPEAWCNIGQLAPCLVPFSGSYNLEMGLDPNSTNYHYVRNALVLRFDAVNYTGNMDMSFMGINFGEENDPVDGVWISNDGVGWYSVFGPWTNFSTNQWIHTGLIDLTNTPVNTSSTFYVAFVQEDNFPYNDLDGIGIDEINIPGVPAPPILITESMTAGLFTTMTVESDFPNRVCKFLGSRIGPGPTTVQGVTVDLDLPILQLADVTTDNNGEARFTTIVHPALSGTTLWLQAVVLEIGQAYVSNSASEIIL
jgi:hypothetical protein